MTLTQTYAREDIIIMPTTVNDTNGQSDTIRAVLPVTFTTLLLVFRVRPTFSN